MLLIRSRSAYGTVRAVGGTRGSRLRLIALGGTIAFAADGAAPQLEAHDLLAELAGADCIDTQDLARISSIGITDAHLLELAQAIERSIAEGYAGIVVTHGTDTLE